MIIKLNKQDSPRDPLLLEARSFVSMKTDEYYEHVVLVSTTRFSPDLSNIQKLFSNNNNNNIRQNK